MKIIYLTTKKYPASTADHIYIRELAKGFVNSGFDFTLTLSKTGDDLLGINTLKVFSGFISRTVSFSVWFLYFWINKRDTSADYVFISNDLNLLAVIIRFRKLFSLKYRICSDWHLMTGTLKDEIVANGSDVLVTTSNKLRSLIEIKFPSTIGKCHTIYGGVDYSLLEGVKIISKKELRDSLSLPKDKKLVGYVGLFKTMGMEKGLKTMIESLKYLSEDVDMVFVGGSKEEILEYKAYASDLGLLDRCVFFERQSLELVAKYGVAMDVLVIPYPNEPHFRDYGFPMKVYDYIASGTPIVYSNLDIISEVLSEDGIAFQAGEDVSLADSIKKALVSAPKLENTKDYSWKEKAKSITVLF